MSERQPAFEERLSAYGWREVLDELGSSDPRWHELVHVAALLAGTPMAGLTLIEERSVRVLAAVGLDGVDADLFPAQGTFCATVSDRPEGVLVVEDALADPVFADLPVVAGAPRFRSYAGVMVHGLDGAPLGTLFVGDVVARAYPPEVVVGLQALARQIRLLLSFARSAGQLVVAAAERDLARTEVERVERLLGLAFERTSVPMCLRALDGSIIRINPAAGELFGVPPAEAVGRSVEARLPPDDAEQERVRREQLVSGAIEVATRHSPWRHADGREVPLLVTTRLVRDDDGTPLSLLSEGQPLALAELGGDGGPRLAEVGSDYLDAVGRDVRTPLTVIAGVLRLLSGPRRETIEEPVRLRLLARAVAATGRLERLLEDTVEVGRYLGGRREVLRMDVDLADLARRALDDVDLGDRTLDLHLEPTPVAVEPSTIRRSIADLLADVAHRSPPGSAVRLSVRPDGRSGGIVEVLGAAAAPWTGPAWVTVAERRAFLPRLAYAEVIARLHGGSIVVRGDDGGRTTCLHLPTG